MQYTYMLRVQNIYAIHIHDKSTKTYMQYTYMLRVQTYMQYKYMLKIQNIYAIHIYVKNTKHIYKTHTC